MIIENKLGITDSAELARVEEKISKEKIETLQKANNVFGLKDGKILTFQEEK